MTDPARIIPGWRGGPFGGWKKDYYDGRPWRTFGQLATNRKIRHYQKIRQIQRQWPKKSYMIGVVRNNAIYIIDGMHRACAVALSAQQKKPLHGQVYIFLMRQRRPLGDLSTPDRK